MKNTKLEKAVAIWNKMTPLERSEIMTQVGYIKSTIRFYRACIKHIAVKMVQS